MPNIILSIPGDAQHRFQGFPKGASPFGRGAGTESLLKLLTLREESPNGRPSPLSLRNISPHCGESPFGNPFKIIWNAKRIFRRYKQWFPWFFIDSIQLQEEHHGAFDSVGKRLSGWFRKPRTVPSRWFRGYSFSSRVPLTPLLTDALIVRLAD